MKGGEPLVFTRGFPFTNISQFARWVYLIPKTRSLSLSGVASELMDLPSHDGTEASSSRLSAMVGSATNGLPVSPKSHYLTPEARLEQGVASSFSSSALETSSGGVNDNVIVHGLPLEAKRQALYGGYYPVPSRDSRGGLQSDMEDY